MQIRGRDRDGIMKCLILAAGYATRLYPLTKDFPKPLLKIQNRTILDWVLDDLDRTGLIDHYAVITNHRFVRHFQDWAHDHALPIVVLDDGTDNNETRLGAVKDIQFAIEQLSINDVTLVIAGDNLLDFSLDGFLRFAQKKQTACVMRFLEMDVAKLRKTGVAEIDETGRIVHMEEKPTAPKSHWCIPPFYLFQAADIPLVKKGIENGCGTDAPGSFIAWLSTQTPVHTYEMPGKRYDIGTLESYRFIQKTYRGIVSDS